MAWWWRRHGGWLFALAGLLAVAACSRPEDRPRLRLGDPAPPFTVRDLDGRPISLTGLAGRPVILRFWSTDCKFCRIDTPVFNRFFDQYRDQGLVVLYVNTGQTEEEVRAFVQDLAVGFPVVRDPEGDLAQLFGIKAQPMTLFLDAGHRLRAAILGGVGEGELAELVGRLFGARAP
ncbi:MAG: TlpA disulfide reductase family protein [Thermodesulfobacteriota bacterium]